MLSIAIQAGGGSRRMGQDKALMPFLGKALIQRVVERLAPAADELIVTTNNPEAYHFLGLPLFEDLLPGHGALGGLYTALACASHPVVAVVACDMPFANAGLLTFAHNQLLHEDVDVVIPRTGEGYEPLHALYRRETCLPAIRDAIAAEKWKVIAWFPQVKVKMLSADALESLDPAGLAFWNLNTPQEFAAAEAIARQAEQGEL
jgi:molybdopterin-guanine dinucleotide biosynthesis protein A